jgi:hypothetical protein
MPSDENVNYVGGGGANSPIVISLTDSYMSSAYSKPARDRKPVGSGSNPASTGVGSYFAALASLAGGSRSAPGERPMSSASSINKMLPPAPPETTAGDAQDRVGLLNAQLSSLGNRRINLTRSIKQMTELMPQDNLMDSAEVIHKREMERRKVEVLRLELADVQREEYELGLKLHRAYKRLDRDAVWENTTLWVRRVTG